MSAMAYPIPGVSIVCPTVCSGADQIKHQGTAPLAFVKGMHRWAVDSPHKGSSNAENVSLWWRYHVYEIISANCPGFICNLSISGRNYSWFTQRGDWSSGKGKSMTPILVKDVKEIWICYKNFKSATDIYVMLIMAKDNPVTTVNSLI